MSIKEKQLMFDELLDKGVENLSEWDKKMLTKLAK
jgi:hypothetical protein